MSVGFEFLGYKATPGEVVFQLGIALVVAYLIDIRNHTFAIFFHISRSKRISRYKTIKNSLIRLKFAKKDGVFANNLMISFLIYGIRNFIWSFLYLTLFFSLWFTFGNNEVTPNKLNNKNDIISFFFYSERHIFYSIIVGVVLGVALGKLVAALSSLNLAVEASIPDQSILELSKKLSDLRAAILRKSRRRR